jgi:hypothetical protein
MTKPLPTRDFAAILQSPTDTYAEGLRFFRGIGLVNETLKQLVKDLETQQIAYSVIGAIALNQHGYARFTQDIDVLMTPEGLEKFHAALVGRGYCPAFEGANKKFRSTGENVPIEVITTGEYPGDGKPKSIVFPDPTTVSVEIDGVQTLTLTKLIEFKLASGITGLGRLKDLADVQELIRVKDLPAALCESLDESVRAMYLELHSQIQQAKEAEEDH